MTINIIVTVNYFVAEIVNGVSIRVTPNFMFLGDAEAALRRMPKDGTFVIKEVR